MTHKTLVNWPLPSAFVFAASAVIPLLVLFLLLLPQAAAAQSLPAGGDPVTPATAQQMYLPFVTQNAGGAAPDADGDQLSTKAINFQNVDGVWSNPRDDNGTYTDPCAELINSTSTLDENQVRYGRPDNVVVPDCGAFIDRSGFGFDGVNQVTLDPGEIFLLGRFTHYNQQIQPSLAPMDFVDLTISIESPELAESLRLSYTMRLDETPNNRVPCFYGATNQGLCDDKVDFINNTPQQALAIQGKLYALEMVGFVPGSLGTCVYADTGVDSFITAENLQNDACVFARLIEPSPSLTVTKTTEVQPLAPGSWADFAITVTNDGNIGLNDVIVHDPKTPDCEEQMAEAMIPLGGALKKSGVVTFTCTANYVLADFENVATAEGVFASQVYSATDNALVDLQAPDTATVRVAKYEDADGDGAYSTGERPLFGWMMCLKDADGLDVGLCQPTGLDGTAMLAANATGDFQVCEVLQTGWVNTDPGEGALCKPVALTEGLLYRELNPALGNVVYGTYEVDLVNRSEEGLTWFYNVYKLWGGASLPMDRWGLTLPSCIDATQIDAVGTTPGYSVDNGPDGAGLTSIWWDTPGDVIGAEGTEFKVKFQQLYATGESMAWVTAGGSVPVTATGSMAGPICSDLVRLGNAAETPVLAYLEVKKELLPAGDPGYFRLVIAGQTETGDIQHGGTTGRQSLRPGEYVVAEVAGTATSLDDYGSELNCHNLATGGVWAPNPDGRVLLAGADDVVCTFTNTRKGSITIGKVTDPIVTTSWPFTGTLGEFSLAHGGQYTSTQLLPGVYRFSEPLTPGWRLESFSCNDPSAIVYSDLPNRTGSVNLQPGANLVCTFTNSATTGTITIIKQTSPEVTAAWLFTGTLGEFSLPGNNGERVFPELLPIVYEVTELLTPQWTLATITCSDSTGVSTPEVDLANRTARISLKPGGNVVCIFKNIADTGTITIDKQVVGTATAPWTFDSSLGGFTLPAAGGSKDFFVVPSGSYTVAEQATAGWYVKSITCTDRDGGSVVDAVTGAATIDLDPGETVLCTYTNSVTKPAIGIVKEASETVVYPNTVVVYTFRVTNRGQTPLFDVWVDDPLCSVEPVTKGK